MVEFKEWLRENMERQGMSQKELAILLDVDESAVSKWLNGTLFPAQHRVRKLAEVFGFDEWELQKIVLYSKEKFRESLPQYLIMGQPVDRERYKLHCRMYALTERLSVAMMSRVLDVFEQAEDVKQASDFLTVMEAYATLKKKEET